MDVGDDNMFFLKDDCLNYNVTINSFYNDMELKLCEVSKDDLNLIIKRATYLNKVFKSKRFENKPSAGYIKIMEMIHTNYRKNNPTKTPYSTTSITEKYILFMYSVDPNFELAIIYGSVFKSKQIVDGMKKMFGIYEPNLIKIEKFEIKNLLDKTKKEELDKIIEKKSYN